jgi:hypothetical protein
MLPPENNVFSGATGSESVASFAAEVGKDPADTALGRR